MKFKEKMNRNYTIISIYVIITAVIIYCLGLVANNASTIIANFATALSWLLKVLKPIIFGFVFAYILTPAVNFFQKRLSKFKFFNKKARNKTFSVILALLLALIIISIIISALVFAVTKQLRIINLDDIIMLGNTYLQSFTEFCNNIRLKLLSMDIQSQELDAYITNVSNYVINILTSLVTMSLSSLTNISGHLTTFLLSLIIGIYFLFDSGAITGYLNRVCYALLSDKINASIHQFLNDADSVFSGYIRGQLLDVLFMLFAISIALSIVGVKFAIVIGIAAGIGNLIPYFGPIIAYASTILVCIIEGDIKRMIIALIVLCIIQAIDANIIGPKLLSKSINIHPLLVVIALIFGSAIGRFWGLLFAVPLGALIKLVFCRFIDNRIEAKENS